jgi:hypothetical protein
MIAVGWGLALGKPSAARLLGGLAAGCAAGLAAASIRGRFETIVELGPVIGTVPPGGAVPPWASTLRQLRYETIIYWRLVGDVVDPFIFGVTGALFGLGLGIVYARWLSAGPPPPSKNRPTEAST